MNVILFPKSMNSTGLHSTNSPVEILTCLVRVGGSTVSILKNIFFSNSGFFSFPFLVSAFENLWRKNISTVSLTLVFLFTGLNYLYTQLPSQRCLCSLKSYTGHRLLVASSVEIPTCLVCVCGARHLSSEIFSSHSNFGFCSFFILPSKLVLKHTFLSPDYSRAASYR